MKLLKNNFLVKFVVTLFFIGVVVGLLFYFAYKPDLSGNLEVFKELITSTHQNTFLSSIVIISAIFVLSISVFGLPAIIFYIFYEGLSIGYTFATFIWVYHIKGGLFYLLFILTSKLVFVLLVMYFVIISVRYIKKFLDHFFSKNREELYKTIVFHFYRFVIVLGITIINSLLIFFFSNKILLLVMGLIEK